MGSFPPPSPRDRIYEPDSAPFIKHSRPPRSRRWLWVALAAVGVTAAVVVGAIILSNGNDDGSEASSDSVIAPSATSAAVNPSSTVDSSASTSPATVTVAPPPTTAPSADTAPTSPPAVVTTVDVASSPPVPSSVEVSIPSPNPNGIDISDVVVSPGNRGGHPVDGAVLATPGVVPAFPATTPSVCVFWTVHRMPHGASNGMLWTRDGTVVRPLADATFAWQGGGSATPNWCFPATPVGIPPGRHRVEYFISGVSQFVVEFVIGA